MPSQQKRHRKAAWMAFGLAALAAAAAARAVEPMPEPAPATATTTAPTIAADTVNATPIADLGAKDPKNDAANEASRAYRHAIATLGTLTALPSAHSPYPPPFIPPSSSSSSSSSSITSTSLSLLSHLFPNLNIQGHGPLASAARILIKLRARLSFLPNIGSVAGGGGGGDARRNEIMKARAVKVVDLLTHAAELGHMDALFSLAKILLAPPTTHFTPNLPESYARFSAHAAATGNATSQAYLAFFHATGHASSVPVDQARAQLYYTFAAHGGDKGAQMALGYRAWSGIATAEDCGVAVRWYELAAEQAMARFLSGPPGGRTLPLTSTRLSDLDGGVFGPGASVASTGLNIYRPAVKAARARAAGETWEDVLEFYIFNADRGESDYMFRLGKIFYQGSIYSAPGGIASGGEGVGRIPRDLDRARHYFERIARGIWPTDPLDPLQHTSKSHTSSSSEQREGVGYAAAAAGYLGRMYMRGEGVRQDFKRARMWFERGAEHGDKECHNGLGIVWRDGLVDGRKDLKKALVYFMAAAGQELPEAQVNVGKHHYHKGDIKLATSYFEAALRHGSPFEAYYYLAQIHARSMTHLPPSMRAGACSMATSFFKVVAERGSWGDAPLAQADAAWARGDAETALALWALAAERGHEQAQNDVAYVLDADRSMLLRGRREDAETAQAEEALKHWTRSAGQNNVDALVKVGDYHLHGLGVPPSPERAAAYYRSAADTQVSALAMWTLGWMYENGVGVEQDFHLAKRHYDGALETNREAYLPVRLALVKLYARSFWHTLRGGSGGLSLWASDDDGDEEAAQEAPRQELEDGGRTKEDGAGAGGEHDFDVEDDGGWYMGRAREEFNRRQTAGGAEDDDDDPIRWAYNRRREREEQERGEGEFGPEDYFEGAMAEGTGELTETVVLVGLCVVVSLLLYVRGRLVERLRREERLQREGQGPQQGVQRRDNQDGGMFPREGDPARDEWAVAR